MRHSDTVAVLLRDLGQQGHPCGHYPVRAVVRSVARRSTPRASGRRTRQKPFRRPAPRSADFTLVRANRKEHSGRGWGTI